LEVCDYFQIHGYGLWIFRNPKLGKYLQLQKVELQLFNWADYGPNHLRFHHSYDLIFWSYSRKSDYFVNFLVFSRMGWSYCYYFEI
jgi:hypothetical protein